VISHGNLIPNATYYFVLFNNTNGTLSAKLESGAASNATESMERSDFGIDVHYFSDARIAFFALFMLKILGRPKRYCALLDSRAAFEVERNLGSLQVKTVSRFRNNRKAESVSIYDPGQSSRKLDDKSEKALKHTMDDERIVLILPPGGFSFIHGPKYTFATYLGFGRHVGKYAVKMAGMLSWPTFILSTCGWILATLALAGNLNPKFVLLALLSLVEVAVKLFSANTSLLFLTVHEFNFLFPAIMMALGTILAASNTILRVTYSNTFFCTMFAYIIVMGLLADAHQVPYRAQCHTAYRASSLLVCVALLISWCYIILFVSDVKNETPMRYVFLKASIKMDPASLVFRFVSTTV